MPVVRRLPSRPNLEFDRKEAKSLLRQLRAGDSDAFARARAQHVSVAAPRSISSTSNSPDAGTSASTRVPLAHAQLVIAREYGFTSWPRLVHYMRDAERLSYSTNSVHAADFQHDDVRRTLEGHRNRRLMTGRMLAAYVPQFYGMHAEAVFDFPITEDDARLAVARKNGYPSWEMLLERAAESARPRDRAWHVQALQRAGKAMESADLPSLQRVVVEHPEVLRPTAIMAAKGATLLNIFIHWERTNGREAMRPILEWLATQGQDLQRELNVRLCGRMHLSVDDVRNLLERGADPN
ncbi:MAG: hypothetical protein M3Y64_04440 [Gemmatimonadota bacterium]|nr:hypothetical protein [Gemmatimonadota bacterium]